jgi:hypothetical protein
MHNRGFVIDGPFMVFADGVISIDRLISFSWDDSRAMAAIDGIGYQAAFHKMSPEQERDYKPMFPVCAQPQTFPVMNPTTEEDVRLFLNACNHETFLRIADDYSFRKRHAEGATK